MGFNREQDSKAMEYWNELRVKSFSTNSEWLTEAYDDADTLILLSKDKGTSDHLRVSYTRRAIEVLAEIEQFLKGKGE